MFSIDIGTGAKQTKISNFSYLGISFTTLDGRQGRVSSLTSAKC